jgi:hypothetical protein
MWKAIDKENTPPLERRGLRAITPPTDNERRIIPSEDVSRSIGNDLLSLESMYFQDEMNSQQSNNIDDKANIESGHAKAVRERYKFIFLHIFIIKTKKCRFIF